MIRPPSVRTGIEVLAEDLVWGVVPLNTGLTPDQIDYLARLGIHWDADTWTVLNSHLWVAEILAANTDDVLGQLVLANPTFPGSLATLQSELPPGANGTKLTEEEILTQLFGGVLPGRERWYWLERAWPASFRLRIPEYPTVVLQPEGGSFEYQIGQFGTPAPVGGPGQAYIVRNDVEVGVLFVDNAGASPSYDQLWFALPEYLVDQLIPPDELGYWYFEQPTGSLPTGGYLSLPLSRL